MKKKGVLLFFLAAVALTAVVLLAIELDGKEQRGPVVTVLRGEVIDRPESRRLLLHRAGEDLRINSVYIPITDGKFEYTLTGDHEEAYELAFEDEVENGQLLPILFFAEDGTVRFTLHPMDRAKEENVVEGGPLNRQYLSFRESAKQMFDLKPLNDEMAALYDSDRLYNERARELLAAMDAAPDQATKDEAMRAWFKLMDANEHYSPEAALVDRKMRQLLQQGREWEIDYARDNVSIPGYFVLIQKLWPKYSSMGLDNTSAYELYNTVYLMAYPDHPYTDELQAIIVSHSQIKPGGKYIDFTAPDFEGNPVTLSDRIEGKVALIDLWASWCGPCRRLSKSMIPVYEKYRDKGFVVVGVAREEDPENAVIAAERDGYPWLNLVEAGDAARIWYSYGIDNAGGATFLVDRDGTILAVSPEADQVEKILAEKLGEPIS